MKLSVIATAAWMSATWEVQHLVMFNYLYKTNYSLGQLLRLSLLTFYVKSIVEGFKSMAGQPIW